MHPDVVNGKDIWMIKRSGCLGLLLKTLQSILVVAESGRQDFDRHVAIQLLIACAIDLTHSAFANLRADFIATKFCMCWDQLSDRILPQGSTKSANDFAKPFVLLCNFVALSRWRAD